MKITSNTSLKMNNVISYRGKVTQRQMQQVMNEIGQIIHESAAQKNGPTVTVTYAVDQECGNTIMDMEVLIPLDKEIRVPSGYTFKPIFRLNNAVKIRHQGNPAMLQNSANELMKYIADHKLMPITAGYNVTVQEPANQTDIDNLIVDMYVGVCDNIL